MREKRARRAVNGVNILLALVSTLSGNPVHAFDDEGIDGGPLRMGGTIWEGTADALPLQLIAERAAPILWFSPDEPLLFDGPGEPFPSRLPCDALSDKPVVYYRLSRAWGRDDAASLDGPLDPLPLAKLRFFDLVYYFYYRMDYGGGCHVNDLESALFRIHVSGTRAPYTLRITRVLGAAHGHRLYANELDLRTGMASRDTSLPITLLVEEGKHATCPDRNADGRYDPGYDVNRLVTDAWGIRDVLASGLVGRVSYESSMTKRRSVEGRIGPQVAEADLLWRESDRSGLPPPSRRYLLRPIPAECRQYTDPPKSVGERCRRMSLSSRMRQERFGEPPSIGNGSFASWSLSVLKRGVQGYSLQFQEGSRYVGLSKRAAPQLRPRILRRLLGSQVRHHDLRAAPQG